MKELLFLLLSRIFQIITLIFGILLLTSLIKIIAGTLTKTDINYLKTFINLIIYTTIEILSIIITAKLKMKYKNILEENIIKEYEK